MDRQLVRIRGLEQGTSIAHGPFEVSEDLGCGPGLRLLETRRDSEVFRGEDQWHQGRKVGHMRRWLAEGEGRGMRLEAGSAPRMAAVQRNTPVGRVACSIAGACSHNGSVPCWA